MNVVFEGLPVQRNEENVKTTSYHTTADTKTEKNYGYCVDFSDTRMDKAAYASHGKTAEDLINDAQVTETAIQSQYMTVMSSVVSGGDVETLREEGYRPCDMETEDAVNTVDRIKATLAEAGIVISGYNDDLDMETLEQITGSKGRALDIQKNFKENDIPVTKENVEAVMKAYHTAEQIPEPDEGTTKYLVENQLEPTVENLYFASYSGSGDGTRQSYGYYDQNGLGYYAKKAEDFDWESLQEQIESIIEEAGLPADETNIQNARFLIEKGIPLTPDTLNRMAELAQISYPVSEAQLFHAAAIAIADGKKAMEADLSAQESLLQQAVRLKEEVEAVTEQAVKQVVEAGKPLTIRNLRMQMEAANAENKAALAEGEVVSEEAALADGNAASGGAVLENASDPFLTAKRQLEEIRLAMTVSANLHLLRRGYRIDTTELSQLVEELKAEEARQNQRIFGTEDPVLAEKRAQGYAQTQEAVRQIAEGPLALPGRLIGEAYQQEPKLSDARKEAEQAKKQYAAAGERYETFMTQPRKDLGDSIQKAFRNVDDILEDLELEVNDSNRRAVRILGYNRTEITAENIAKVKDVDLMLQRIVRKLTPAAALQMIREDRNPLQMSLAELEQYLTDQGREENAELEKYSEYLFQLDRSGQISEEERESYIGIYRLFRQVEKSDGAVIGNLLGEQAELTVSGLLSALRSRKKSGMDVQISDETGALSGVRKKGTAIDEQIETAFRSYAHRLADDVYDRLDLALLRHVEETVSSDCVLFHAYQEEPSQKQDISLEKLRDLLAAKEQQEEAQEEISAQKQEYCKEQVQEIRKIADIDDSTIQELLDGRQPVTVNTLLAAQAFFSRKNSVFHKLQDELARTFEELPEAFSDQEHVQEAYQELIRSGNAVLEEAQEKKDIHYHEIKDIRRMADQLKLADALSKEEHYTVPVPTKEGLTTIHLTLRHQKAESGRVSVSMNTEKGRIQADFTVIQAQIYGRVSCSAEAGRDWMKEIAGTLQDHVDRTLGGGKFTLHEFSYQISGKQEVSPADRMGREKEIGRDEQEGTGSSALYGLAKAFLYAVREQNEERNR